MSEQAHGYVADQLQLEQQSGRMSYQIIGTLLGGVLLVCSIIASLIARAEGSSITEFHATTLAAVSAILLGAPLVIVAIKDLIEGHMHMNELVALAVIAAFAIGEYMEAAAIAFFMIISVLIENRTALGARASIESLIRITPTRASKLTDEGEQEVDARDLSPGDVVRVRPGDNIPADGRIISGLSTVNQANITGESLPVDKTVGDEVFGGTINLTGAMDVEVTKAGQDTTLGRVKELILQAEQTRIPIMRMIDSYAGWYTPTVLMLVGIVLFFTLREAPDEAFERAIAMLVIACPCPLILATPTAMVAALSAAARLGVLIKSVIDLEAARNLTAMVFDKTGTLTTGQLQVTRLSPFEGVEGADLLLAAASVEQNSTHPVARAVTDVAKQAKLTLSDPADFDEVPGRGVRGRVTGENVWVGRGEWLIDEAGDQLPENARTMIEEAQATKQAEGLSLLFVAKHNRLLGWIGLADNTRPQAAAAIDELRELGLREMIIVTGDRESVARRIAGQMHTNYKAQVLPHEKLDIVSDLREEGHQVAVIGDGVNDAPALAAGDISIAMGAAGSDVAIHSASIALMNNNLNRIPFLIRLSHATSSVIKQNMAIGMGFIVVFFALAALGMINPILAALLHVVSSLIVVFNSARLVRSGEAIEQAEHEALDQVRKPAAASEHEPADGAPDTGPAPSPA